MVQPGALMLEYPWAPSGDRLALTALGRMELSTVSGGSFEIECWFERVGASDGKLLQAWAPFEHLALLKLGAVFEHRRMVGQLPSAATRQATAFAPVGSAVIDEQSRLRRAFQIDEEPWGMAHAHPCYCVGRSGRDMILIPSLELLRFYLGSLGLSGRAFFTATAFAGRPGAGLINPDETLFLDDDVFQIAPNPGYGDRASALQLALLLTSEDLMDLWGVAASSLTHSGARGAGSVNPVALFTNKQSLALAGRRVDIRPYEDQAAGYWRAFQVTNILTDFRRPPFTKLVVKLPYGMGEADLDDFDEGDTPRSVTRAVAEGPMRVEDGRRPGRAALKMSPHHQALRQGFPGLGRVEVRYEVTRARRRADRALDWRSEPVAQLSAMPAGKDPQTGRVSFRPATHPRYERTAANPTRRFFLDEDDVELGRWATLERTELPYPLSTFVGAMLNLSRQHAGGLIHQEAYPGGAARLLHPPPSWGPAGRGRALAVGFVDVVGLPIYAFELSRRHRHERISLGLVLRADGAPMSPQDLSRVGRYAVEQLSTRGARGEESARGIWPSPEVFMDLHGRIVAHTYRRRDAAILAEDLNDLARSLIDPDPVRSLAA